MRYSRQELVIGKEAQKLIQKTTVAIVGIGALGTVAANLLARSGFNLILIDHDKVELSNLQRQSLFNESDIKKYKATLAKNKLKKVNSKIKITSYNKELTKKNLEILKPANIILDCTDNLLARFILNDYCKKNKKPWIHSAAIKDLGTVKVILPNKECFMCFTPESEPETCEQLGILNTTSHIVASIQVQEAMKIAIKKRPETSLIRYKNNSITLIKVKKRKNCRCCNKQYDYL